MTSLVINVVVEGPSERAFINSVVAPMLGSQGIYINASVVGRSGHKGGNIKFDRMFTDIRNYLKQQNTTLVTTMIDYFRLDPDWPGMAEISKREAGGEKVELATKLDILQTATTKKLKEKLPDVKHLEKRFIPYIQMHEFEALLFSSPSILANKIEITEEKLQSIIRKYETPEHINTNPEYAPSKLITRLCTNYSYKKRRHGLMISQEIGLSLIRQKCKLFNNWLNSFTEVKF
ncbi:DUF4276 family protein [Marinospirillum minutulum]|uniref:DUF4276 family protein n=1 Tax=Marinospirillum minutulum TaxID=64974 RepID=UPI0003F9C06F|nr:DUF4276 family protein [Marinospirillum minutulum]